ncbi:hypothetical protein ABW19_dt0201902 [Dactylella cylindrospora]|nr:hypothetical protein ABW19_dt0201902 [Dactylella cylindrospora]
MDDIRLSGRLGNLSDSQDTALINFKILLAEKGLYAPEEVIDEKGSKPPSHSDAYLLKFLRARRFNLLAACCQFEVTEKWRASSNIGEMYDDFDVEEFQETRKYFPQWIGRRDKNGVPIQVYEVGALDSQQMNKYYQSAKSSGTSSKSKLPATSQRIVVMAEHSTNFVMPLCSTVEGRPHDEAPIETTVNIVDISGLGFRQFFSLQQHLREASSMAQSYYPEALEKVFVIGAPRGAAKTWDWAKGWFDVATTGKVFFLSGDNMLETLKDHIDIENIPKKYGGELDWKFGDAPVLDGDLSELLTKAGCSDKPFPGGTIRWAQGRNGSSFVRVVGTKAGQKR